MQIIKYLNKNNQISLSNQKVNCIQQPNKNMKHISLVKYELVLCTLFLFAIRLTFNQNLTWYLLKP